MRLTTVICAIFLFAATFSGQTPTPTPTPAPSPQIREEVVVIADRNVSTIDETPASVTVLTKRDIDVSATPTIDETLRQSVGFSTFRRTGSRTSNPTTQGVSFRGAGSSGASRAVVFFDSVPLNDPFGGWVQWERVPGIAVEQVEVLRGGASSLYGNYALSGAVNIIPRKTAQDHAFSAEIFAGGRDTFSGSAFAGKNWLGFNFDGAAAVFQTKGSRPVDEAVRGPVDALAGVRYSSFLGRLTRELGKKASVFFRPTYLGEVRTNGTGLQTNRTHIRQLAAGGKFSRRENLSLEWRAYGGTQVYDQIFSAVNATRTAETLTRIQRVPAQNIGGSLVLFGVVGDHSLIGGLDVRQVRGTSDEIIYANGSATTRVGAGGRETSFGVFFRDLIKIGDKLVFAGGLRSDRWQNSRGLATTHSIAANTHFVNVFSDRAETAFSPQAAILFHANDNVSIYASASSSFRSPTLNELYRTFRVGNVNTLANADLRSERTTNAEGGFTYKLRSFRLRSSLFWTKIDRAVSNITISTTQNLITRQRKNAGATRSAGFEIEAEATYRKLHISTGYLFVDPRVVEFATDLSLIGLRVPQAARHQLTFQIRTDVKKLTFAFQGRAAGKQFDDDQNLFRLEPFLQIDLFASHPAGKNVLIFAALENVTNTRYSTGKTPIRSVSPPINFRAGIRWK